MRVCRSERDGVSTWLQERWSVDDLTLESWLGADAQRFRRGYQNIPSSSQSIRSKYVHPHRVCSVRRLIHSDTDASPPFPHSRNITRIAPPLQHRPTDHHHPTCSLHIYYRGSQIVVARRCKCHHGCWTSTCCSFRHVRVH